MAETSTSSKSLRNGPLEGLTVIDMGHALAGPFAATMLGDFGARVLKVEKPGGPGDTLRGTGPTRDGIPIWWKAAGRNKDSITLDFTKPRGKELLLELIRKSDVLIENFRPGTLERYGLGWSEIHEVNPRLVMLRISGYGQHGPQSKRPGFGRIGEAMSGAAHLTGEPDGTPRHVGFSLADTTAGLMGAYGVLLALMGRSQSSVGDCIDLALYEPLFRLIDWQVIVYQQLNISPIRAGNNFPSVLGGIASGVAKSSDEVWMTYSVATDASVARLAQLVFGETALEHDERFNTADGRRLNVGALQDATSIWISQRTEAEVMKTFETAEVPVTRVYDMESIWHDETFAARKNIVHVADDQLGDVAMHSVLPTLLRSPGLVRSTGPLLGENTEEILRELCGIDESEFPTLRDEGVI